VPKACQQNLYVWAPGSDNFALPNNTAIKFGKTTGLKSLFMQVHYNNPEGVSDATDSSGFTAFLTTQPRQHECAPLWPLAAHLFPLSTTSCAELAQGVESTMHLYSWNRMLSLLQGVAPSLLQGVTPTLAQSAFENTHLTPPKWLCWCFVTQEQITVKYVWSWFRQSIEDGVKPNWYHHRKHTNSFGATFARRLL
jgi:hypothetical protein